jgi:hypothetical protein
MQKIPRSYSISTSRDYIGFKFIINKINKLDSKIKNKKINIKNKLTKPCISNKFNLNHYMLILVDAKNI